MAKIITFKGKTAEELKQISIEEFVKLLPSRQRRSLSRGLSEKKKKFLQKLKTAQKPPRTHCRDLIIIPEMIDKTLMIHNGKEWIRVDIQIEMLGHRLGEFALTRKKTMHSAPGVGATKSSKFLPLK